MLKGLVDWTTRALWHELNGLENRHRTQPSRELEWELQTSVQDRCVSAFVDMFPGSA